jgi:DNA-directed RNA polymerase specialized sigma24 family protein
MTGTLRRPSASFLKGPVDGFAEPAAADRAWFERTIVELLPDLFGAALRLTRNRTDAEDLVAEAVAQ